MVKCLTVFVVVCVAAAGCACLGVYGVRVNDGLLSFMAGAGTVWFGMIAFAAGLRMAVEKNLVDID